MITPKEELKYKISAVLTKTYMKGFSQEGCYDPFLDTQEILELISSYEDKAYENKIRNDKY